MLVVGVISDADTASYKRTPIVNEAHRAQAVGAVALCGQGCAQRTACSD